MDKLQATQLLGVNPKREGVNQGNEITKPAAQNPTKTTVINADTVKSLESQQALIMRLTHNGASLTSLGATQRSSEPEVRLLGGGRLTKEFMDACYQGKIELVKHLVDQTDIDVNAIDNEGYMHPGKGTVLHALAHKGHRENYLEIVKYLLSVGANPSIKNGWGQTPVAVAKDILSQGAQFATDEGRSRFVQIISCLLGPKKEACARVAIPSELVSSHDMKGDLTYNLDLQMALARISTSPKYNSSCRYKFEKSDPIIPIIEMVRVLSILKDTSLSTYGSKLDSSLNYELGSCQAILNNLLPSCMYSSNTPSTTGEYMHRAVMALKTPKDPRAVPQLVQVLEDNNHVYACDVIEALGSIGDKSAVQPIIKYLKKIMDQYKSCSELQQQMGWLLYSISVAFKQMASPNTLEPLVMVLNEKDFFGLEPEDRNGYVLNTMVAIGAIGTAKAIETLISIYYSDPSGCKKYEARYVLADLLDNKKVSADIAVDIKAVIGSACCNSCLIL